MDQNPEFAARVRCNWAYTGNEVGWFYVNDPQNGLTIQPWPDDSGNTFDSVVPPKVAPPNTVAEGHTHPDELGYGNGPWGADYRDLFHVDAFVFDPKWVYKYHPGQTCAILEQKLHGLRCRAEIS